MSLEPDLKHMDKREDTRNARARGELQKHTKYDNDAIESVAFFVLLVTKRSHLNGDENWRQSLPSIDDCDFRVAHSPGCKKQSRPYNTFLSKLALKSWKVKIKLSYVRD